MRVVQGAPPGALAATLRRQSRPTAPRSGQTGRPPEYVLSVLREWHWGPRAGNKLAAYAAEGLRGSNDPERHPGGGRVKPRTRRQQVAVGVSPWEKMPKSPSRVGGDSMVLRPQYAIRQARTRQVDYVPPKDSCPVNLKEPRFSAADGEWRVAFAFDTTREAILLVAGDKSGSSEKRFYRRLVPQGR